MLRKVLSALAGFSVLCLVIAAAVTHAVHAQVFMRAIGLPEKGLVLIGPADPSFEDLASKVLKGRKDFTYETLKPYSVILQNTTAKTVVAYALRWEYPAPKGQIGVWDSSYGQSASLLDGNKRKTDPSDNRRGLTIEPNGWKLITPKSYIGSDSSVTSEALAADSQYGAYLQSVASRLGGGDLTVTLDGAFFEDGTFVGPDQSGFFEIFKAQVTAKNDLMARIVNAAKAGQGLGQVADEIESSLPEPRQTTLGPGASPADFYEHYRRLYASEFLGIRNKLGDQAALGHAHNQMFVKPPVLVKDDSKAQ